MAVLPGGPIGASIQDSPAGLTPSVLSFVHQRASGVADFGERRGFGYGGQVDDAFAEGVEAVPAHDRVAGDAALAAAGQRVCLIDLDPQAHASLHLGVLLRDGERSVYDVLTGDLRFADVRRQFDERLSLVPAHLDLAAAEVELAGQAGKETILRDKLAQDPEQFDYVVVDCPPSLGILTINALTMVREVFLPLQPHQR